MSVTVVLGFDFGLKRIGVAVGQSLTGSASPVATLVNPSLGGTAWRDIDALVAQWRPTQLVVGLPLPADGSDTEISLGARALAAALEQRSGLAVALVDERLSSHAAEERLRASGVRGDDVRRKRDSAAAALIVETWLAQQHH